MVNMGHHREVYDPVLAMIGNPKKYIAYLKRERVKQKKRASHIQGANSVNERLVVTSKKEKEISERRHKALRNELKVSMYAKHMPWLFEEEG